MSANAENLVELEIEPKTELEPSRKYDVMHIWQGDFVDFLIGRQAECRACIRRDLLYDRKVSFLGGANLSEHC